MLTAIMAASMTGCGNNTVSDNVQKQGITKTAVSSESKTDTQTSENDDTVEIAQLSNDTQDTTFTERDLEQIVDTSEAQSITVADNKTIDITEEGVYTVSGTAQNCTIRINADETAKIQLVLDGIDIENEDSPAIYVLSADKVFITTTETDNTLTVSGQFTADGETNTDAVIYSKDDIVLNGTGTLNITSNKDGFHCENDETEGDITISGGTFAINGGSDGIQACGMLQIDGETFDITGSEGLEATYIIINDGNITINASDDGINASASSNAYETAIVFNGGNINVTVGQGDTDAIDANGSIYVNGGTINVTAQMSSFDYDRTAEFNGGTIIINGEEVSEIPQSMMGGGMHGGMGGNPEGGFGGGRGGRF